MLRNEVENTSEGEKANTVGAVQNELRLISRLWLTRELTEGNKSPCEVFNIVKSFGLFRVLSY